MTLTILIIIGIICWGFYRMLRGLEKYLMDIDSQLDVIEEKLKRILGEDEIEKREAEEFNESNTKQKGRSN